MDKKSIKYPFIPEGKSFKYASLNNKFMQAAKKYAKEHSLDKEMPTGSVIVKDGEIISYGANGSDYHDRYGCERVRQKIPTGERYDLCEGCHPKNHAEPRAINSGLNKFGSEKLAGSDLYLWGHWWACDNCWSQMIQAGINNVYLLEDSEKLFNKKSNENIVGKQFI